jgi:hypothetical protein
LLLFIHLIKSEIMQLQSNLGELFCIGFSFIIWLAFCRQLCKNENLVLLLWR